FVFSCVRGRSLVALTTALASWTLACGGGPSTPRPPTLDTAAASYVRLVLALGERDADSLDAYHGRSAWQVEARGTHAALPDVRAAAAALAGQLAAPVQGNDDARRRFLLRQLHAIVARIDVIRGA